MKVFGQLEKAQIEQLSADPTGTGLVTGRVWYNTTDDVYRGYDGSSVSEFADLATAQTFQNKILTGANVSDYMEFDHATTPANPAAGKMRIFPKSDGTFYTLDENGNEVPLGAGGGGSKNYFSEVNAEIDSTVGDWLTDDGVGGASAGLTVALTAVAGELRAGSNSLKLSKDAANRTGHFFKVALEDIDPADRGGALYGSFSLKAGTGYVAGDLVLEVYDTTNAAVLYSGPAESLDLPNSEGRFDFTTYLESTTAQVEFRLKVNNTNTNALEVYADEFKFGPSGASSGAVLTDATGFTPIFTNFTLGNGTVDIASYWIEGARMHGAIKVTLGSTSVMGANASVSVPGGESIDTALLSVNSSSIGGVGSIVDTGTLGYDAVLVPASATELNLKFYDSSSNLANISSTVPMTWTTGDTFELGFDIPIAGRKASNMMNTNLLHLQTAFVYTNNVQPTGTLAGAFNKAIFGAIGSDMQGMYNTTTGVFTAPKTGILDVSALLAYTYTPAAGILNQVKIINTTSGEAIGDLEAHPGTTGGGSASAFGVLPVSKGDLIEIQSYTSGAAAAYSAASSRFSISYKEDFTTLGVVKDPADEGIILTGHTGFGSTNGEVVRFTTVTKDTSPHLTLTQSATLGDSITINTTGLYSMSWYLRQTGGGSSHVMRNAITAATLDEDLIAGSDDSALRCTPAATALLTAGDVIRGVATVSLNLSQLRIIKIG